MVNLQAIDVFIWLFLVVSADELSREENRVTRVSSRDYTYAKPTTVHKRINVQRIVENVPTSTLDPFKSPLVGLRRKGAEDIWSWDFWCHLQPKMGNCSEQLVRYYYDTQLDECRSFTFSGCGGNKNNFLFMDECQRHCNGATFMNIKETENTDYCEFQPSSGLCMALFQKFYYDVNTKTCHEFSYGGCGGNPNRFESIALCMGQCRYEPTYLRNDPTEVPD